MTVELTNMDHWRYATDSRKPKHPDNGLYQWHFVHHKSHIDWSVIEPEPRSSDAEAFFLVTIYQNKKCHNPQDRLFYDNDVNWSSVNPISM